MAATTDSFRSSLHGFNRMDVVQFIQKTTSEHELELRRLAEERTRQQEELEQQKKELAARQEESERQKQELSQLRAELAELREDVRADTVDDVRARRVIVAVARKDQRAVRRLRGGTVQVQAHEQV